ncbi:MAG TPA: hypothetical protein VFN48_07980 [Solirubrobacteraceae bacterium]|nr:hypothetical protein [Solirubrobacteraceae bacterium]
MTADLIQLSDGRLGTDRRRARWLEQALENEVNQPAQRLGAEGIAAP